MTKPLLETEGSEQEQPASHSLKNDFKGQTLGFQTACKWSPNTGKKLITCAWNPQGAVYCVE